MVGYLFLAILVFSLVAFHVGRATGRNFAAPAGGQVHSLPSYHGAFVAVWVGVPALMLLLIWVALQGKVIDSLLIGMLPAAVTEGAAPAEISLILSEIKNVAAGRIFGQPTPEVRAAAEALLRWEEIARWSMVVVVLALMLVAMFFAHARLAPRFQARNSVERFLTGLMIAAAAAAILITIGIIASLVIESASFFNKVPIQEFLFGLRWEPQMAIRADQVAGSGAFGAVPVFMGTLLISVIAMVVAVPVGLFAAIFLVEYASEPVRNVVKPILEMLAGVPTVVYGFFAVLTVAPAVRQAGSVLGIAVSPNAALAAGAVMGIMLIPFISSLSDDALRAVPRTMRDGSLAMGATRAETMTKVLLPAALPGIMGGILLALSRAIGETMIVVMAAGLIATLTINPIDSVTTVTVQIVTLLIGDTEFDSPKTLAAFALGLVLFLVTLGLNVIALTIVRKYREQYD
ncbi:MAG: phosphate ABC transporter permease subunit PstC [Devosia sp.]|nr:phosphate ABC transporter permease subunit PstC [Devosia sp.]